MFRQRLLTTLILVPLVLALIFLADSRLLDMMVLALVLTAGVEWQGLVPLKGRSSRTGLLVVLTLLSVAAAHVALCTPLTGVLAAGFWLIALMLMLTYPASETLWGHRALIYLAACLLLPLFAGTLHALCVMPRGRELLVYVLLLVWAADIGAYLAGKAWGRHKLLVRVSPGKTVEGLCGGLALSMLVAFGGALYFAPPETLLWYGVAFTVALVSVIGDLFFSMLKRRCGLKDTGRFFPGHGGMLDRIDSLIAALPLFYLACCHLLKVA
ncbi:phosphatidate cytidylyltransferase [Legionella geestiana]|uniref:Phosphatidate cytidylyltransferase n=1 Tax=Legionella geestiana TaxID=45065 RepID=A0A0W0TTT8_9GAMM|nr:phosphatidate cytidylyltransferase [Legionella geestiana]KTC98778.1 phosphatidate cytidylyltransferase [Legionella geestiana]QBS12785.1 phosphatidate cytidylyltransferase [Legionella geestiana]STX54739.1 phosphatidate cytidylyltransferase [Legionella geestiana]